MMHAQKGELQESKRQSKITLILQTMRVWFLSKAGATTFDPGVSY